MGRHGHAMSDAELSLHDVGDIGVQPQRALDVTLALGPDGRDLGRRDVVVVEHLDEQVEERVARQCG